MPRYPILSSGREDWMREIKDSLFPPILPSVGHCEALWHHIFIISFFFFSFRGGWC